MIGGTALLQHHLGGGEALPFNGWTAALGGALGGTLGMRVFHHKTKHKEFRFGFPALLCVQCAAVVYLILIWKQVI